MTERPHIKPPQTDRQRTRAVKRRLRAATRMAGFEPESWQLVYFVALCGRRA